MFPKLFDEESQSVRPIHSRSQRQLQRGRRSRNTTTAGDSIAVHELRLHLSYSFHINLEQLKTGPCDRMQTRRSQRLGAAWAGTMSMLDSTAPRQKLHTRQQASLRTTSLNTKGGEQRVSLKKKKKISTASLAWCAYTASILRITTAGSQCRCNLGIGPQHLK